MKHTSASEHALIKHKNTSTSHKQTFYKLYLQDLCSQHQGMHNPFSAIRVNTHIRGTENKDKIVSA